MLTQCHGKIPHLTSHTRGPSFITREIPQKTRRANGLSNIWHFLFGTTSLSFDRLLRGRAVRIYDLFCNQLRAIRDLL